MSEEFKKGMTAGIVLAIAELLRAGMKDDAKYLLDSSCINEYEELTFCADYDLKALREAWPEFADAYGFDAEDDESWHRDDERTLNTTLLISDEHFNGHINLERIAKWTDIECQAVEKYCTSVHINASDNDDFLIPDKPDVLSKIQEVA